MRRRCCGAVAQCPSAALIPGSAMQVAVPCPRCLSLLQPSAEVEGRDVRCPRCGHTFVLPGPAAVSPPVLPPYARASGVGTGIQPTPTPASRPPSIADPESIPGQVPSEGRKRGWVLFGLRFGSPLTWLGGVILFFLPWLDIRCVDE